MTLEPSKDNTLYQDNSGALSNGAGDHLFAGKNRRGQIRRTLLAFDVSGSVPAGSTIKGVTLGLHMSRTAKPGPEGISVHVLLADWGEGVSDAIGEEGRGNSSAPGDATWIHRFFDAETWATPGGDFSPQVSASLSVGDLGDYSWGSTAQLVQDVQSWADDPQSNFGWILVGNESTAQTAKRFDSRENGTPGNRPLLTITFTPP